MKQRKKTAMPEFRVRAADGTGGLTLAAAHEEAAIRMWLVLTHRVATNVETLPMHWEFVAFDQDGADAWVVHAALPPKTDHAEVVEYVGVCAQKVRS